MQLEFTYATVDIGPLMSHRIIWDAITNRMSEHKTMLVCFDNEVRNVARLISVSLCKESSTINTIFFQVPLWLRIDQSDKSALLRRQ